LVVQELLLFIKPKRDMLILCPTIEEKLGVCFHQSFSHVLGLSVPVPDIPLTATPTLEASGDEAFLFFTTDTITAFRLRSSGLSNLLAPLSATDLQSLVSEPRTREQTRLLGAAGCGTGCISLVYGVRPGAAVVIL
jgi:hypothetical protein